MESINYRYIIGFIVIALVLFTCINYIIPYLALSNNNTLNNNNTTITYPIYGSTLYCLQTMCLLLVPILAYGFNYIIYHSPEYYSYIFVVICMLIIFIYYYYDLLYYKNSMKYFTHTDCVLFIIIFSIISYSGYMIRMNGLYMPPNVY